MALVKTPGTEPDKELGSEEGELESKHMPRGNVKMGSYFGKYFGCFF